MNEIKVRFHSADCAWCRELWEVYTEEGRQRRYVIRDTADPGGCWETACGEFCEPGSPVRDDVTFILCDHDWNEQARTGNDRTRFPKPFPTLEQACFEEWDNLPTAATLLPIHEFRQWIAKWKPQDLPYLEDINWCDNSHKPIQREILHRFNYCGAKLAVIRLTQRHTLCRAIWRKYFVGEEVLGDYESYIQLFGYECGNYIIQTNPLMIANLPYHVQTDDIQMTITRKDLISFNARIGVSGKSPYCSRDPKIVHLVSLLKQQAAQLNKDLTPTIDKNYMCATCGSRSGKCHPVTGYCFICGTDNWTPVNSNNM